MQIGTLDADREKRNELWQTVMNALDDFLEKTDALPVSKKWAAQEIRNFVRDISLESKNDPKQILHLILSGMSEYAVHTPHPRYFGLFNPRTDFLSAISDFITAAYNPQLAAWTHAPFAVEVECYIIEEFGKKFGYQTTDGTFCTGGAESNVTAVLCALQNHFPQMKEQGITGLAKRPLLYCSVESHHSMLRAAQVAGLGRDAVRLVETNEHQELCTTLLEKRLEKDGKAGFQPLMIVATAGTTGSGAIDPLKECATLAKTYGMWFHVDAAYGGAAILSDSAKSFLEGIHVSDSITIDLHKWISIPMGASLFLTRHSHILHHTFGLETEYMPSKDDEMVVEPYAHSMQWSRRFIGLKSFFPLAVYGWSGYASLVDRQLSLADHFRRLLEARGWQIRNSSRLPIVCFSHASLSSQSVEKIAEDIINEGNLWLSTYPIGNRLAFRVCMTNYASTEEDLLFLLDELEQHVTRILNKK